MQNAELGKILNREPAIKGLGAGACGLKDGIRREKPRITRMGTDGGTGVQGGMRLGGDSSNFSQ